MAENHPSFDIIRNTDTLYISAWPREDHEKEIIALGVWLILSMNWGQPEIPLGDPPLCLLWLPVF